MCQQAILETDILARINSTMFYYTTIQCCYYRQYDAYETKRPQGSIQVFVQIIKILVLAHSTNYDHTQSISIQ